MWPSTVAEAVKSRLQGVMERSVDDSRECLRRASLVFI